MGSSPTKSSTQQTSLSQKILNEYSVKDIARQMCIMDYNLFKAIKLSEYYRKQFEKDALKKEQQASNNKASKQKETSNSKREDKNQTQQIISSNVLKATERFNQVNCVVCVCVCVRVRVCV
jgi:ribosomal protein S25